MKKAMNLIVVVSLFSVGSFAANVAIETGISPRNNSVQGVLYGLLKYRADWEIANAVPKEKQTVKVLKDGSKKTYHLQGVGAQSLFVECTEHSPSGNPTGGVDSIQIQNYSCKFSTK